MTPEKKGIEPTYFMQHASLLTHDDNGREFEYRYWASQDGTVYNESTNNFLEPQERHRSNGELKALTVSLFRKGSKKPYNYRVHRLVAFAWLPIPIYYQLNNMAAKDLVVHHLDYQPSNNCVDNLKWASPRKHRHIHARNDALGITSFSKRSHQRYRNMVDADKIKPEPDERDKEMAEQ